MNNKVNNTNRNAIKEFVKKLYEVDEVDDAQCERMLEAFADLNDREEVVVKKLHGLDDGQPLTLDDASKYFGTTRERIRQVEYNAIVKLHHPNRIKKVLGNK